MSDELKVPLIYAAISEVMQKLSKTGISKDNKNTQQGYKFRGIDDVYNALAPVLSECRLLILPRVLTRSVTERETKNGGALFYVVLDVEFDFVSAVDGSKHVVRVVGEAMDSGDKATNKAMSAAYKYACMEAFCIPTEGDNDADAQTHEVKADKPWTRQDTAKAKECAERLIKAVQEGKDVLEIWDEFSSDHDFTGAVWTNLPNPVKNFIRDEKAKRDKAAA